MDGGGWDRGLEIRGAGGKCAKGVVSRPTEW